MSLQMVCPLTGPSALGDSPSARCRKTQPGSAHGIRQFAKTYSVCLSGTGIAIVALLDAHGLVHQRSSISNSYMYARKQLSTVPGTQWELGNICWPLRLTELGTVVVAVVLFLSIHTWTQVWVREDTLCSPERLLSRASTYTTVHLQIPITAIFLLALSACLLPPRSHPPTSSSSGLCSVPRRIKMFRVNGKRYAFCSIRKIQNLQILHVLSGLFGQNGDWRSLVTLQCQRRFLLKEFSVNTVYCDSWCLGCCSYYGVISGMRPFYLRI